MEIGTDSKAEACHQDIALTFKHETVHNHLDAEP